MKKLLLGILAFLVGFISFSSAYEQCFVDFSWDNVNSVSNGDSAETFSFPSGYYSFNPYCWVVEGSVCDDSYSLYTPSGEGVSNLLYFNTGFQLTLCEGYCDLYYNYYSEFPLSNCAGSSPSDITVLYNNGLTTSVACNGDNIITINGLSTMSSISTFTPYFNVNYIDQSNQVLTDSYSNSILYISGGQYLKTYTGGSNNDWVLNLQSNGQDTSFTGYLPSFDVTGNITDINTGNVFNNFAENSLSVLFTNIPSYIQYVIMFALLLFVLGIFRRLRK